MVNLNRNLIKSQNLTDTDILELEQLHETREALFQLMADLDIDDDLPLLRTYVVLLESLEYNMQRVWKFEQNKDYHTWWFKSPHCTCGCGEQCKLHSGFVNSEQKNEKLKYEKVNG